MRLLKIAKTKEARRLRIPTKPGTWADIGGRVALMDLWRDRVEYPDLIEAIKNAWVKWGNYRPVVYIEDKASGQSALQTLRRERVLLDGRATTIPVKAWLPPTHSSKESRADAVTPAFRADDVLLPQAATWLADWIEEHVTFPTGAHDDDSVPSTGVVSPLHAATIEVGCGLLDGIASLPRPQGPQPCDYTVVDVGSDSFAVVLNKVAIESSLM